MGRYNQQTGYIPQTVDEIMEELRIIFGTTINLTTTQQEFLASNLYNVFLGVATSQSQIENAFANSLNEIYQYFISTNQTIKASNSATNQAMIDQFKNYYNGVSIVDPNNDSDGTYTQRGSFILALDRPINNFDPAKVQEDKQTIIDVIRNVFPIGVHSGGKYNEGDPELAKLFRLEIPLYDVNQNPIPGQFFTAFLCLNYDDGVNPPVTDNTIDKKLLIQIEYRKFDGSTGDFEEKVLIEQEFLKQFKKTEGLGNDFEPTSYLSTALIPFVAQFKITSDFKDNPTGFIPDKREGLFNIRYTIEDAIDIIAIETPNLEPTNNITNGDNNNE